MKRIIPFLLSALLLTGCHSGANQNNSTPEQTTIVTTAQTTSAETTATTFTTAVTSTTAATSTTFTASTEKQSATETTFASVTGTVTASSTITIQTVAESVEIAETEGEPEMKEEYITSAIEVTEFDEEDIITTSNQAKINDDGSIELPIIPIR